MKTYLAIPQSDFESARNKIDILLGFPNEAIVSCFNPNTKALKDGNIYVTALPEWDLSQFSKYVVDEENWNSSKLNSAT